MTVYNCVIHQISVTLYKLMNHSKLLLTDGYTDIRIFHIIHNDHGAHIRYEFHNAVPFYENGV